MVVAELGGKLDQRRGQRERDALPAAAVVYRHTLNHPRRDAAAGDDFAFAVTQHQKHFDEIVYIEIVAV